jgi:hypothetical protein
MGNEDGVVDVLDEPLSTKSGFFHEIMENDIRYQEKGGKQKSKDIQTLVPLYVLLLYLVK